VMEILRLTYIKWWNRVEGRRPKTVVTWRDDFGNLRMTVLDSWLSEPEVMASLRRIEVGA